MAEKQQAFVRRKFLGERIEHQVLFFIAMKGNHAEKSPELNETISGGSDNKSQRSQSNRANQRQAPLPPDLPLH